MYCFGCGDDATSSLSNRLRMNIVLFVCVPFQYNRKMLSKVLKSKDSNINIFIIINFIVYFFLNSMCYIYIY